MGHLYDSIEAILTRTPPDTPVVREYQRRLDDTLDRDLGHWDASLGLLIPPGERATFAPEERLTWTREARAAVSRRADWQWYYRQSRQSAAVIGRMAFCYRSPFSRYHRDARILALAQRGLEAYREHQIDSGEFVFCPIRYADIYGPHEQAWRIEPLVYALVWLRPVLPPGIWKRHAEVVRRAAGHLRRSRRPGEINNRGAVWCAVMALCGRFLEDGAYLAEAADKWESVRRILADDGQLLEGIGPDSNYSFTGLTYAYLYRVFSGDDAVDASLVSTLRWFAKWHSPSGFAFEGMSCRVRRPLHTGLADLLGPFERYAAQEPFYLTLRRRYLDHLDAIGAGARGSHGCSPLIWAMLEHDPASPAVQAAPAEPGWYRSFTDLYATEQVAAYVLIKRAYQTAVTLKGPMPLKGLQTWAHGLEPPIVCPGEMLASGVSACGCETAAVDAEFAVEGTQTAGTGPAGPGPASAGPTGAFRQHEHATLLSTRQGPVRADYIFTPYATVVVYRVQAGVSLDDPAGDAAGKPLGDPSYSGGIQTTWACNLALVPEPRIGSGVVEFPGLQGRLYFTGPAPDVQIRADGERGGRFALFLFRTEDGVQRFAFADGSFRWGDPGAQGSVVAFEDPSGAYRIELPQ